MKRDKLASDLRSWVAGYVEAWETFWFTPRLPYTLGLLRILTGAFLLYSHLVLASDLNSFVGEHAWVNNETARALHDGTFGSSDAGRSYLWWISNPSLLWLHHGVTMAISAAFMVGFMTRITAPLAWFLQIMYLHRLTGALFGFDQIITYSTMYLMIAPCGSCFSIDAHLRERWWDRRLSNRRLAWLLPEPVPSVSANVATRLFQLHLCVIYLFGGLAKARGQAWWDGTAMWYSIGNYEYQSVDLTWLHRYPRIFTAMTHATMFWEIFYCAIIWPKRTRPLVLAMAVAVHGGIALFLGMMTFGMMMIVANGVFIEPETVRRWLRINDETGASDQTEPQRERLEDPEQGIAIPIETPVDTPAQRSEREAKLDKREMQVRATDRRLRTRRAKLKEKEAKYRERVENLKRREAKIKDLVERRRAAKAKKESESEGS